MKNYNLPEAIEMADSFIYIYIFLTSNYLKSTEKFIKSKTLLGNGSKHIIETVDNSLSDAVRKHK